MQNKLTLLYKKILILLLPIILIACNNSGSTLNKDSAQSTPRLLGHESSPYFISAIAAGESNVAATGGSGYVIHSTNGHNWSFLQIPNSTQFTTMSAGNGKFVTAGLGGQVYAASEKNDLSQASNWKSLDTSQVIGNIRGATYFHHGDYNGFFLVDDQGNIYFTQADTEAGLNNVTLIQSESSPLFAITAVQTVQESSLVAVGTAGKLFMSSNGQLWNQKLITNNHNQTLYATTSGPNGTIIAVGEHGTLVTSSNGGISFTENTIPGYENITFTGVNYHNKQYTITPESQGYVLVSKTPSVINSWHQFNTDIPDSLYGIASFYDINVFGGESAVIAITSPAKFTLDQHNQPQANIKDIVSLGNNRFVLLGSLSGSPTQGYVATYSYNGDRWTLTPGTQSNFDSINAGVYATDQTTLVTVGRNGQILYTHDIANLPNSLTPSTFSSGFDLNTIDYFNGVYAAGGNNTTDVDKSAISTTTPGSNQWRNGQVVPRYNRHTTFGNIFSITHNDNHFIMGANSTNFRDHSVILWASSNANNWLPNVLLGHYDEFNNIFYNQAKTIIVGSSGQIYYINGPISPYGNCNPITIESAAHNTFYKTAYDDNTGQFIVVGNYGSIATVAFDAIHTNKFTSYTTLNQNSLHGVACNHGLCVVAGDNGTLAYRTFGFSQVYPQQ